MLYQQEFTVRQKEWFTIASPADGIGTDREFHIQLRIEPYTGQSQGLLEWRTADLPPKDIRDAVLRGLKSAAMSNTENAQHIYAIVSRIPPIVKFKVIITSVDYAEVEYLEIKAQYAAFAAFKNAISQTLLIPTDCTDCTNYWETDTEGREVAFEVLPNAFSTLAEIIEGEARVSTHELFAYVKFRFEPYSAHDLLCSYQVPEDWVDPHQLTSRIALSNEECIGFAFRGIQESLLSERGGHGVLVNIKATLLSGIEHIVNSRSFAFFRASRMAFEDAVAKTTLVNLK